MQKYILIKSLTNHSLGKNALLLCSLLALVACGGGGDDGGTSNNTNNGNNNTVNQAPSNVLLGNVTAASQTAVDVSWTAAIDDTTPANQLTYEVHLAEGGDFNPSASTLKFSGKNVLSTQLIGLKVSTYYTVKLVVVDTQNIRSISSSKSIQTLSYMEDTSFLNDTGITECYNQNNVMGTCDSVHLGGWFNYSQDAQIGRDALATKGKLSKIGGGSAGFDFTKISATGQKLPASATVWSCVLDNHTGLMWENKTDDNSLHDKDNKFVWYSPDVNTNGGYLGSLNNGQNTYEFVNAVRLQGLCNYNDWRLPTIEELQSIAHYGRGNPSIDTTYFQNTMSDSYWSSSPVWVISFDSPIEGYIFHRDLGYYVRLVRTHIQKNVN